MIDFNYVLMVIVFVACLYLAMTLVAAVWKSKRKQKQPSYYDPNIDSLNVTPDEFYKVLNFMLMYGIIDLEQYNQINQKGLPYTG